VKSLFKLVLLECFRRFSHHVYNLASAGKGFLSYKCGDAKIQTGEALDKWVMKYSHTLKLPLRVTLF